MRTGLAPSEIMHMINVKPDRSDAVRFSFALCGSQLLTTDVSGGKFLHPSGIFFRIDVIGPGMAYTFRDP